ncbi:hypothetical protein [Rubellimicrobium aerolatum]|uniref:Uncharacterized protein n=1 Tax=Rubellimicrobium aerolatum TaxID=490979 RepID=A0ABW0S834_9RHOB|nr:hypothetical protein [Rubellimicrobium aerolatum]MBP1804366.1 hypothetical protein [Rubellimicrobium aerolatum]
MRRRAVLGLLLAGACGPGVDVRSAFDPAERQRRAAVEVAVKSAFPGILDEIEAGGGPGLAAALDAAGVAPEERAARVTQLRGDLGLYQGNPGALAAALALYGG